MSYLDLTNTIAPLARHDSRLVRDEWIPTWKSLPYGRLKRN